MAQTAVMNIFDPNSYTERSEYVQQSGARALQTPFGSVPLRPTYGSKLHKMVSYPITEDAAIIQECNRALDAGLDYWIEVESIKLELSAPAGSSRLKGFKVYVNLKDKKTDLTTEVVVPFEE